MLCFRKTRITWLNIENITNVRKTISNCSNTPLFWMKTNWKWLKKHAKNNERWPVITTPNLNCCLSSSNKRKSFFAYFSGKTYLFEEIAQIVISTHLQTWLTYHFPSKQDMLREDSSYSQRHSFIGYMYVSSKASRAGHDSCSFQSSH